MKENCQIAYEVYTHGKNVVFVSRKKAKQFLMRERDRLRGKRADIMIRAVEVCNGRVVRRGKRSW